MSKYKALVMNASERRGRLLGCGVLIVNTETGRPLFIGKNALSMRLKADYEKAAARVEQGVARLIYPNQLTSFKTDNAYFAKDSFSLWQQDIDFEPDVDQKIFVDTESLNILPQKTPQTEEVEITHPFPYYR